MVRLTVVVPARNPLVRPNPTLDSLDVQTYQDFVTVIQLDPAKRGACWARNQGFTLCRTELVLFCDDDIEWAEPAFETMIRVLDRSSDASYVYCSYRLPPKDYCKVPWDADLLRKTNYISTMSIIRAAHFPGFDESILRLQDWDLWLTMLRAGRKGVWAEGLLFTTVQRAGITFGDNISWNDAVIRVREKHKDWL